MRLVISLILLGTLALPTLASTCFCLVDDDDAIWFDCREQKRPLGTKTFCTDVSTKRQAPITDLSGLTRVAEGDAPCTPCRLSDVCKDCDNQLRGEDEDAGQVDSLDTNDAATQQPPPNPEPSPSSPDPDAKP